MINNLSLNGTDISFINTNTQKGKHTFIDLFAGGGGLSIGLELAGFEGLAAVEFEPHAVRTYRINFKHPVIDGDIKLHKTKERIYNIVGGIELDVLCGGFPCQGFSTSGLRMIDDPRNALFKELVKIASVLKPKVVIGENVTGILTMGGKGKMVQEIIRAFNDIGYDMDVYVLNAADYGVPQTRERVIFVGNRIGVQNLYPMPTFSPSNYVTVWDAIGDLENCAGDFEFNHEFAEHAPMMIQRLSSLPAGANLYPKRKDAWRRLEKDKPSFTVKDCHGACAVHPTLPRTITVREMARLQSFPDTFRFAGAKKYQQKQVGNAVPPLLGKAIGLAVQKMLEE